MGNKLKDMLDPNSEYNKKFKEMAQQQIQERKEWHCCEYCNHSEQRPHYEMGYDAGTDNYCKIYNKLMLDYYDTCLLFEEKQ